MATKRRKTKTEEITDLDPAEVTLTFAPAVREETIMMKSEVKLETAELAEVAKALGIADPTQVPQEKLDGALKAKIEGLEKAGHNFDEEQEKKPEDVKNVIPTPGDNDDEKNRKPSPFDDLQGLDKSVSERVTMAAKALLPVMQSLPPEVQKFFGQAAAQATPEVPSSDPPPPMQPEMAKSIMKSIFGPDVMKSITAPFEKQVTDLSQQVGKLQNERDLVEMKEIAKSISPDVEGAAKFLLTLRKSGISTSEFNAHIEERKRLFIAAQESDQFSQISKSIGGEVTPEEQVMAKANEIVSKSEKPGEALTLSTAIKFVLDTNPTLAAQYHSDMQRQAGSVNGGN